MINLSTTQVGTFIECTTTRWHHQELFNGHVYIYNGVSDLPGYPVMLKEKRRCYCAEDFELALKDPLQELNEYLQST